MSIANATNVAFFQRGEVEYRLNINNPLSASSLANMFEVNYEPDPTMLLNDYTFKQLICLVMYLAYLGPRMDCHNFI